MTSCSITTLPSTIANTTGIQGAFCYTFHNSPITTNSTFFTTAFTSCCLAQHHRAPFVVDNCYQACQVENGTIPEGASDLLLYYGMELDECIYKYDLANNISYFPGVEFNASYFNSSYEAPIRCVNPASLLNGGDGKVPPVARVGMVVALLLAWSQLF